MQKELLVGPRKLGPNEVRRVVKYDYPCWEFSYVDNYGDAPRSAIDYYRPCKSRIMYGYTCYQNKMFTVELETPAETEPTPEHRNKIKLMLETSIELAFPGTKIISEVQPSRPRKRFKDRLNHNQKAAKCPPTSQGTSAHTASTATT